MPSVNKIQLFSFIIPSPELANEKRAEGASNWSSLFPLSIPFASADVFRHEFSLASASMCLSTVHSRPSGKLMTKL